MKNNQTSGSGSIMLPQAEFDRLLIACALGDFMQVRVILAEAACGQINQTSMRPLAEVFHALADIHRQQRAVRESIRETLRKLAKRKSGHLCRESLLNTLDDFDEMVSAKEIEELKAWTATCLACGVNPKKHLHDLDPYLVGSLDELEQAYEYGLDIAPEVVKRIADACMAVIESELSESEWDWSGDGGNPLGSFVGYNWAHDLHDLGDEHD